MFRSDDELYLADIYKNEGKTDLVYKKHNEEKKKKGRKDNDAEKIGGYC